MRQPVLTPCCKLFLRLAFCCFYYYNHTHRLAWKTLPLCLTVNYSAFVQLMEREFFPAHLWREEINTPLPKAGHSLGDVSQDWRPFTLPPHGLSLSILPFDFSSSFVFWSIKEPGIHTPIRWWFWGTSLPSSRSAGSLISLFLASIPHLSDSLACHAASRASLA